MKKLVVCLVAFSAVIGNANAQVKKTPVKPAAASVGGPAMKNLLDSFSYAAGINIANNMKDQGISNLNAAVMVKAMEDVFKGNKPALAPDECNVKLQAQMAIFNKKKEEEAKKINAVERAKGEAFLASNKNRKEVTTLPDGLQYEILKAGDPAGIKPTAQDTVVVDYRGTLTDGKEFDASKGTPVTFPVGGVIKGWTEILQLMTKGAHWKVYIPAELAYGERGAGAAIPGGAALIFEITLQDIKPAVIK